MEHICMYLRKSRADLESEARGEGETLARHEKILLDHAKRQNLNISKIYREIVSGETIASRPVMQQLLSEVEQGLCDGVLVVDVERLARGDTMDQGLVAQTFKYSGTKIITPVKTYDPNNEFDEEYFEFGLFMSRREYKTINRRLQSGRLASVKEGKYVGNIPPFGYLRKKLEKEKGYTLEPYPKQADVVRMIFEMYSGTNRMGVSLIVRELNRLKIPPARGDVWIPASVQSILHNPVYVGKIRWNARPSKKKMVDGQIKRERPRAEGIIVDGLHPPIINIELWNQAQEYLSLNPAPPIPDRYKVQNPLAGIVICGKCDRRMIRRPYNSRQPDTLMCPAASCNNVSAPLYLVEKKLLLALENWLEGYLVKAKEKQAINKGAEFRKKALQKIEEKILTLEKQKNKLYDLLEQGIYTTDKFQERNKNLSGRIDEAQHNKNVLLDDIKNELLIETNKKEIISKAQSIIEAYDKLPDAGEKNKLLKAVLIKVVYLKEKGGRWSNNVDNFQLEVYPRLPKL